MQIKRDWEVRWRVGTYLSNFYPSNYWRNIVFNGAAQRVNLKDLQENITQVGSTIAAENTAWVPGTWGFVRLQPKQLYFSLNWFQIEK